MSFWKRFFGTQITLSEDSKSKEFPEVEPNEGSEQNVETEPASQDGEAQTDLENIIQQDSSEKLDDSNLDNANQQSADSSSENLKHLKKKIGRAHV